MTEGDLVQVSGSGISKPGWGEDLLADLNLPSLVNTQRLRFSTCGNGPGVLSIQSESGIKFD